jgi:hypothetical protein
MMHNTRAKMESDAFKRTPSSKMSSSMSRHRMSMSSENEPPSIALFNPGADTGNKERGVIPVNANLPSGHDGDRVAIHLAESPKEPAM